MYPAPFEYFRPATLDEAIALLSEHGDAAKVLAGGHSLIPAMKLRLARPGFVVDIGRVTNLRYIQERDGHIAIGPMTTHHDIESSDLLKSRCPLLPEVAAQIGDAQVRNRGTIGGSLIHADPAADWPAAVLALDAELELAGPNGRRVVPAGGFFVDLFQTAAGANEILCEIRVPPTLRAVAYEKADQKASGFALAGIAVVLDGAGRVRVGVTGVAATPYRATAVEQAFAGGAGSPEAIGRAAARVGDGIRALGDIHASAEFRLHLAEVHTVRALARALSR